MNNQEEATPQETTRLLRLKNVMQMTGLSQSEIYKRMSVGTFPKPLKLGARLVAWPAKDIENWIQSLIKEATK